MGGMDKGAEHEQGVQGGIPRCPRGKRRRTRKSKASATRGSSPTREMLEAINKTTGEAQNPYFASTPSTGLLSSNHAPKES